MENCKIPCSLHMEATTGSIEKYRLVSLRVHYKFWEGEMNTVKD